MRTFCIYCPELPKGHGAAEEHFKSIGMDVAFFRGIHGEHFGVLGTHPYRGDHPQQGWVIGYAHTGMFLSHYMLWNALSLLDGDRFMILEDDAEFPADWRKRLADVHLNLPSDTDVVLIGSSNTKDKPSKHVKGPLYEVKWPFCTHAYILHRKALPVLLDKCRDAYTNIDIAMVNEAYPFLKVLTVLPRIAQQRNMTLEP